MVPRNVGDPGKLSFDSGPGKLGFDSGPTSLAGDLAVISGNLIFPVNAVETVPDALSNFLA